MDLLGFYAVGYGMRIRLTDKRTMPQRMRIVDALNAIYGAMELD